MSSLAEFDLRLLIIVGLAIAAVWLVKRWGPFPSKDPAKIARWRVLPMRFKVACWFGVTPLFVLGSVLLVSLQGFAVLAGFLVWATALVCMLVLEGRVIAWYRANGHFPAYDHETK